MYVGSAQARSVIREYEFYYPKKVKKIKKKKSGQIVSESKHDRIKFDVLLTSYEMINLDTTSLKPIKWECMVRYAYYYITRQEILVFRLPLLLLFTFLVSPLC
jgi:SNF2 family DNA or RNA helicase